MNTEDIWFQLKNINFGSFGKFLKFIYSTSNSKWDIETETDLGFDLWSILHWETNA